MKNTKIALFAFIASILAAPAFADPSTTLIRWSTVYGAQDMIVETQSIDTSNHRFEARLARDLHITTPIGIAVVPAGCWLMDKVPNFHRFGCMGRKISMDLQIEKQPYVTTAKFINVEIMRSLLVGITQEDVNADGPPIKKSINGEIHDVRPSMLYADGSIAIANTSCVIEGDYCADRVTMQGKQVLVHQVGFHGSGAISSLYLNEDMVFKRADGTERKYPRYHEVLFDEKGLAGESL